MLDRHMLSLTWLLRGGWWRGSQGRGRPWMRGLLDGWRSCWHDRFTLNAIFQIIVQRDSCNDCGDHHHYNHDSIKKEFRRYTADFSDCFLRCFSNLQLRLLWL